MNNLPQKKDKLLSVFSQKGLDYYKIVHDISLRLLEGEKALNLEKELINMQFNEQVARRTIIRARELLKKNLPTINEDISLIHTERYDDLVSKYMKLDLYELMTIAMEQQEMIAGLHSKGKTTIINNNLNIDYTFIPDKLERKQQDELSMLIKKAFVLTKGNID